MTTNSKKNIADSSKQVTTTEKNEWYDKHKNSIENFERAAGSLQYIDPSKTSSKTFSVFSKELLRTYMKNPLANHKNLRNLSRFLYYRSQIYRRMVTFNSDMIDTNYKSVIPHVDLVKGTDQNKMLKSYYDTLLILDKMNLASEMLKVYTTCWIEDVFFGVYYFDAKNGGGFVLQLDPDYCKLTSIYPTGDFGFDFDCSYFRNHKTELELWGSPFTEMYSDYQIDPTNGRWQSVPDEYAMCMKINTIEPTIPIPPYINLFDSIINIEDLKDITSISDEADIYKLLVAKIPLSKEQKGVDDFAVDPKTAIDYFNKIKEQLPEYVDAIISPIDIDAINFEKDQGVSDVNKVENASKNILKTSGHGILAEATGSTAVAASIKADEDYAISSLITQTESWVNRFLSTQIKNASKVKFLEVTKYTKEAALDSLIKGMNYGLPVVTTIGVLNGYSELDMLGMANINNALGLDKLFKPLATSSTRSAEDSVGGRPTAEDKGEELGDEAEKSRDKKDRAK